MSNIDNAKKTLKILGILTIVLGVLGLFSSLAIGIGGGVIATGLATSGADAASADTAFAVIGGMSVLAIVALVSSIIDLLLGIFSVRAANDFSKIGPAWVLAVIGLILAVIGTIMTVVGGGLNYTNIASSVVSIVFSACLFWAANTIKNNA